MGKEPEGARRHPASADRGLGVDGRLSVDRAMSASTVLPTAGFAALATVTVLLVAMLGMSGLGPAVGPGRAGGQTVSAPRLSITLAPPAQPRVRLTRRETPNRSDHQTVAVGAVGTIETQQPAGQAATAVSGETAPSPTKPVAALPPEPGPALPPEPGPAPPPELVDLKPVHQTVRVIGGVLGTLGTFLSTTQGAGPFRVNKALHLTKSAEHRPHAKLDGHGMQTGQATQAAQTEQATQTGQATQTTQGHSDRAGHAGQ